MRNHSDADIEDAITNRNEIYQRNLKLRDHSLQSLQVYLLQILQLY